MNNSDAAIEVCEQSGVNYKRCYQCKTCSLGCPFTTDMDYLPHQLIRKVQLGELSDLLSSKTIWYCASCETCVTRCPNQIDIPRLMDSLRQMALQKRAATGSAKIRSFHYAFLEGIRRWGRQYELGMLLEFKIRARDLFSDLLLGMKMLLKSKLALLPGKNPGSREVHIIFRKTKWMA